MKAVGPNSVAVLFNCRGTAQETSERLYLHETQRQLDVCLHNNHNEEIRCAFRGDRANQRRKLERAPITVRVPCDDKKCG